MSLPNSYIDILAPGVDGIRKYGLWEVTRSWGGALMDGISVHIKVTPERVPLPLLPCEDIMRRQPSMNQEASSYQTSNLCLSYFLGWQ